MKKDRKNKKRKGLRPGDVILLAIMLTGFAVLFYPTVSDAWNTYRNSKLVTNYAAAADALSEAEYEAILREARAYNDQHTVNVIVDAFNEDDNYVLTHPYDTLLNPAGDEVMGYISIPKIDVQLPIFHGTAAESLEQGAGHIEGTSLPIGGRGTHAVLSAHRGLPSAKLFTDLDQLEEGDLFFLRILNETLAYEVDQILVVLPEDVDALAIDPDEDYVTLVTCTPYAVNTHRLLVRGHRTEYTQEDAKAMEDVASQNRLRILIVALIILLVILLALLWLIKPWKKRKEDDTKQDGEEGRSPA